MAAQTAVIIRGKRRQREVISASTLALSAATAAATATAPPRPVPSDLTGIFGPMPASAFEKKTASSFSVAVACETATERTGSRPLTPILTTDSTSSHSATRFSKGTRYVQLPAVNPEADHLNVSWSLGKRRKSLSVNNVGDWLTHEEFEQLWRNRRTSSSTESGKFPPLPRLTRSGSTGSGTSSPGKDHARPFYVDVAIGSDSVSNRRKWRRSDKYSAAPGVGFEQKHQQQFSSEESEDFAGNFGVRGLSIAESVNQE